MAEFIAVVQNRFVFLTCVSRCQLQFVGQMLVWRESPHNMIPYPVNCRDCSCTSAMTAMIQFFTKHAKESSSEDDRRQYVMSSCRK